MNYRVCINEVVKGWKPKGDVHSIEVQGAQALAIGMVIVNLIMLIPCVMGRLKVVKSSIP